MSGSPDADALSKEMNLETNKSAPKPTVFAKEKEKGETLPGWTIMRPLQRKKKAYGATKDGEETSRITAIETNESGEEVGVGQVETFSDLRSDDDLLSDEDGAAQRTQNSRHAFQHGHHDEETNGVTGTGEYKVYKRRFFGLFQLILLNIVVSWDWLTYSANSTTSATFYNVTPTAINWLSTSFMFAFVVISPVVIFVLHKGGPKMSIMIASALLLVGNWIRYASTKAGGHYGGVMAGQIFIGFAQPFVLAAPTRYSDLWFSNRGRVAATAAMSLANPLGGALAQLINPFWATENHPEQVPNMVLYVSLIATVACVPSFFIPHSPPTPVAPSSEEIKQPLGPSIKHLLSSPEFYMIMVPFVAYVGLFNSISTLINQIMAPYGFSEDQAGIGGALLIVVGLIASAISSPIIDKTKSQLLAIKICVPIIALAYLAFTFAPGTRALAASYVILSILGAASFSMLPVALEYVVEITHPISPEVTSTVLWTGGQLAGGIFIIISDALRDGGESDGTADDGTKRPPGNLYRALIFQAVVAMLVMPFPLCLGLFGRHKEVRLRRVHADRVARERQVVAGNGDTLALP